MHCVSTVEDNLIFLYISSLTQQRISLFVSVTPCQQLDVSTVITIGLLKWKNAENHKLIFCFHCLHRVTARCTLKHWNVTFMSVSLSHMGGLLFLLCTKVLHVKIITSKALTNSWFNFRHWFTWSCCEWNNKVNRNMEVVVIGRTVTLVFPKGLMRIIWWTMDLM